MNRSPCEKVQDGLNYFVNESHILSGACVAWGTCRRMETAYEVYKQDTLFDLASLTKLFTALSVMRLKEQGRLKLEDPLSAYDSRFASLQDETLFELMAFGHRLVTPGRIDEADDPSEGLRRLFHATALPHAGARYYSDLHAMVLKYVIEAASGLSFYEYIKANILGPLKLNHIYAQVPPPLRGRAASCNREHRIENDCYLLRTDVPPGTVHDPKARVLSRDDDICGHAGLFGTLPDMARLCQAVLAGEVVSYDSLSQMAINRTGEPVPGGGHRFAGHTQYLGFLCFVKHPDQHFSEIPPYMSSQAIALSGFTGHHLSIDPGTGYFCVMLGNRCHNRLTTLIPPAGKTLSDYGLNPDGSGQITWPDGQRVYSSVRYVYKRDEMIHAPVGEALKQLR